MKQITVSVPATSANLGPGFDCLALALGLYNRVTLATAAHGVSITIDGEGSDRLPRDATNLVARAADRVFKSVGKRPEGIRVHQQNNIPVGSGLGSSAAATLAGMLAANRLVDGALSATEILQLATEMEQHPDNVAAAYFGGLTLVNQNQHTLHVECIDIPLMWVVVILPDFELSTLAARAALPKRVALSDAVFNIGRTALLLRALEAGDYDMLTVAMEDRLHQEYRLPLIPGMNDAFVAARAAGAAAVVLSGAGPSLAAFAPDGHEAIQEAVTAAFASAGVGTRTWILAVDSQGSRTETSIPE